MRMDDRTLPVPGARRWSITFLVGAALIALFAWRDPTTGWGERLFLPFVVLATGLVMLDTSGVRRVPVRAIQAALAVMVIAAPLAVIDSHTSLILRIVALPAAVWLIRWIRQAAPEVVSRGRPSEA